MRMCNRECNRKGSLSHSLSRSASYSPSLFRSSLSALHSPFAYQLTARILISFQHCSSSAASLYQSPNPSCRLPPPLEVTQTTLLKTKFHFYFKCQQQQQLKAKVYVK